MMTEPGMEGLRTDQAPPLSIPASFFLVAPVAMIAAGWLLVRAPDLVGSRWLPTAMAATHLGTLGFLAAIMMGAVYQMIPVVAGAPVPAVRSAHAVHAVFALGAALLVSGFAISRGTHLLHVAPVLLAVALVAFLVPVGLAMARAPTRSDTVTGMRLAVAGLAALATLGVLMALTRAGYHAYRWDWVGGVSAHAALGGLVWIGGLITAVSWQVVPMFYVTPPLPRWTQRATLVAVAIALVGAPSAALAGRGPQTVAMVAAPAAAMVWLVHPVATMLAIRRRRRRRVDGSVRFWWAGMLCAPLLVPLAMGALWGESPKWSVALGWTAVWGWAGLVAHGMLSRILPFLVWFHRYSALVGKVPVPTMRGLLPDGRIRAALAVHGTAVVLGLAAIATGWEPMAKATGVVLAAAGVVLGVNLVNTLRQRPG